MVSSPLPGVSSNGQTMVCCTECVDRGQIRRLEGGEGGDDAVDTAVGRSAEGTAVPRTGRQLRIRVIEIYRAAHRDSCDACIVGSEIECSGMDFEMVSRLGPVEVIDHATRQHRGRKAVAGPRPRAPLEPVWALAVKNGTRRRPWQLEQPSHAACRQPKRCIPLQTPAFHGPTNGRHAASGCPQVMETHLQISSSPRSTGPSATSQGTERNTLNDLLITVLRTVQ